MTLERTLTRRGLLRRGALLSSLASLPLLQGCGGTTASPCIDPALLSPGEEQMRRTLEYVELSAIENQSCSNCAFFSAADERGCGHCEILAGPVSAQGYCTSWAQR